MVQWLGIGIFTAVVQVQFLIRGTKIQQAVCCDQKKGQYSLYHTWHNLWFIYEIGKNFKKNLEHNTPWQRVERIEQLNNSLLSNHVVKHCLSCKIGVMVNWMYKSNFKNWIISFIFTESLQVDLKLCKIIHNLCIFWNVCSSCYHSSIFIWCQR